MRRYRRNADEDLRRLERMAASGDPGAAEQLGVAMVRARLCPRHGLKLTGKGRKTCSACRAERKAEIAHEKLVRSITRVVYEARRDRNRHPEGEFDNAGRWYPSDAEDADGDVRKVRSPSRAWPYSYMLRARTRDHCRVLVERGLAGLPVPGDVEMAILVSRNPRTRIRRNADEGARRHERELAASPTQEMVDRVVLDKLRAGRPGEITLHELQQASEGLIPREVAQRSFQDSFDRLWDDPIRGDSAELDVQGATVGIMHNQALVGTGDPPRLIVDVDTGGIDPEFFWEGTAIPRLSFYANAAGIHTNNQGGFDFT